MIGARNDDTGIRWQSFPNMCLGYTSAAHLDIVGNPPWEGVASGIICKGNNITIENCEISGFQVFGAQIRDMVSQFTQSGDCYSFPDDGEFHFRRNYIHNCKIRGYGYGVWVSGGSGQDTCITQPTAYNSCQAAVANGDVTIERSFKNFDAPNEVATIDSSVFFDNGKDIDATMNRNSMNISACTFSERVAFDANIHRHTDVIRVCNQNQLSASSAFCQAHPAASPCVQAIYVTGGHLTIITNNDFHRPVYNIMMPYPNMNECTATINGAFLQITNNRFNTLFVNSGQNSDVRIEIGDWLLENWNYKANYPVAGMPDDPNLDIGETPATLNHYNQFYTNLTPPNAPHAIIASSVVGSGFTADAGAKEISAGEKIEFESILSTDGSGNLLNVAGLTHCVLMYHFHTMSDEEADEVRVLPGTIYTHEFKHAGITDVNLMIIDLVTGKASNIATQQITIKPVIIVVGGSTTGDMRLTFDIKDSHTDRLLSLPNTGPCLSGFHDSRDLQVAEPPTGFELYAMVDGHIVWSQDIAGDSGWQHIDIDLRQFPQWFTPPFYGNHTLEIGARAVGDVDADRVRGFEFYIDNAFIDAWNGTNCLWNGDLEIPKSTPSVTSPSPSDIDGWDTYNEYDFDGNANLPPQHPPGNQNVITFHLNSATLPDYPTVCAGVPFPYILSCGATGGAPTEMYLNISGGVKSTHDVRAGHYSYEGWIRPLTYMEANCGADLLQYYTGLTYHPGFYKALVYDGFHRNPVHLSSGGNLRFELWPVPAASDNGTTIVIKENDNSLYKVSISDIRGKIVYQTQTKSKSFIAGSKLMPGIYYVAVSDNNKSAVKKLVVVK